MRKNNGFMKKRNIMIALFIVLVAGVSIGYAALQTTLTINGTTKIKRATFCVEFQNATPVDTDVTGFVDPNREGAPTGDSGVAITNGCTDAKAAWTVTLSEPGDFYSFDIDVVNTGTLLAELGGVNFTKLTDLPANVQKYLSYTITPKTNTSLPQVGDTLASNGRFTLNFKVAFRTDIDPEDLPSTAPDPISFQYKLTYNQKRSS